jgi:hypothetical protein
MPLQAVPLAISVKMPPRNPNPEGAQVPIAVIIRRDLAPMAAHLRDEFSGLASLVAVIIDRRYRDRRQSPGPRSIERRQADRRRRNVADQLREGGWAVIPVDDASSLR